jgi:prepilin-type N-terminal cleavage/methylation domain-containing protein
MSAKTMLPTPAPALPRSTSALRRLRSGRGFTLIELMIVVTVIGILATFAIPYFQRATARARRSEMQTVLDKLHVYFINQYESEGSFATSQFPVSTVSAWNPDPATPTGQPGNWVVARSGWQQIPFAFDGGLKMRYQYTITSASSMTITVVGDMPGLGPPLTPINGVACNYSYVEVLQGPVVMNNPTEYPSSF